jgi:CTP synthase (UTP-ammonia lyase)
MGRSVNIGIIGEYNETKESHPATNAAIRHAADRLSATAEITWLPSPSLLSEQGREDLKSYDAVWASSGSPYASRDGALAGIRLAREGGRPFIGT